jgi:hypothetical protein
MLTKGSIVLEAGKWTGIVISLSKRRLWITVYWWVYILGIMDRSF